MMSLASLRRNSLVLILFVGLTSAACNKKTDVQPQQKATVAANSGQPAAGTTHLRDDGIEELNIPAREVDPGVGGGISSFEEFDDFPAEHRPRGIGSTRIQADGTEELIIPLRER